SSWLASESGSEPSLYDRCALPVRTLATRAPEEIASLQLGGAHCLAAHVARLARTAVDVDLAAMVVDPRRPAHRLGGVLGPNGVDPVVRHALVHQLDQIGPHRAPLFALQRVPRPH